MESWSWALASARGTSHEVTGDACQDAAFCCTPRSCPATLIAVLSDGAGSAAFGGAGAKLVVRTLVAEIRDHFARGGDCISDEAVRLWINVARDRIAQAASRRNMTARDFAATMICVVSHPQETLVAHIGDGAAVAEGNDEAGWHALSWPAHGEYASTTFFVTDETELRLVISRRAEPITALVAFTDGLERLALDFAQTTPHTPFFKAITAPLRGSSVTGRDPPLCDALARYLNSPQINERTDDDKTLLVAIAR